MIMAVGGFAIAGFKRLWLSIGIKDRQISGWLYFGVIEVIMVGIAVLILSSMYFR